MSIIRNSLNCTCSCRFRGVPWLDQLSRCRWMHRHWGSCRGTESGGGRVLEVGHGGGVPEGRADKVCGVGSPCLVSVV